MRISASVAQLAIQHDVPVHLTGAEWRALGAQLTPDGRMTVRTLYQYVLGLIEADLRRRQIDHEPLVVRELRQEVTR